MPLTEDIIFSDPALQRIFFDERRVAPRSDGSAGKVANHWYAISEYKVAFLKEKRPPVAEYYQGKMRAHWFALRKLCDGYFLQLPAGHDDGCEHVETFAHADGGDAFKIDSTARAAYWYRYARQSPPPWGDTGYGPPRRRKYRGRRRV